MSTLTIRKKSLKTWLHTDSILGDFIISKFYFNADNVSFQIVEQGQSRRVIYNITDITLYALPTGGTAETFTTITELSLRLEELNYPAFQYDGQITSIANLIDAGTGVTITGDGTAESPYIINSTGGAGSQTLAETLVLGNITDGTDISISDGDKILLDNGANLKKGTTDAGLGGSKGIALRCAVDYELKWEAGRLYVMGGDGFTIREVSHNFTTTPTVNDDDTKGFVVDSRWILDDGDVYVCTDDTTGAAVWVLQSSGIPTLQEVLDNNHDLVDGNNFQGTSAGVDNTGGQVNGFGSNAALENTGNNINALGDSACSQNSGSAVNALGDSAAQQNTGNQVNALGYYTGSGNTGNDVNFLGSDAGSLNIGNNLNALGSAAGQENEGENVNGLGYGAAAVNTADNVNALGVGAGSYNTFKNVNLFGFQATADAENQNVFSKWISGVTKYLGRLSFNNITADRKWELPDADGTIALTSDITTPTLQQVTDEGATTTNAIETGNIIATDVNGGEPVLTLNYDTNLISTIAVFTDANTGFSHHIDNSILTETRYIALPDASGTLALTSDIPAAGVTSVGLTMPSAFSVTNSPITSSGDIAVSGAGSVSQYVRGDGSLANFPASTGGGASLSFYLNGSVSQGTIGGVAFREMDRTPILGAGTDFTINADGYIQSFITDANVPNQLEIPAGNWNFETYFSASSGGGSPSFYVELYKWNGTTLSLIASNSATPEGITNGTAIDAYFSALAVPQTSLLATDRLAIRIYVTHSGRTITLHTEDNHLCQVITTFSTGLTALNGLTAQVQNLAVGTSGTDFAISSATATHTFNLPTASATNRGALSSTDWSAFNGKQATLVSGTNIKTINGTSVLGSGDLVVGGSDDLQVVLLSQVYS